MDTTKVTRLEVIDHTKSLRQGGGRCYTFWSEYDENDIKNPVISLSLQDSGKTLKIFIEGRE